MTKARYFSHISPFALFMTLMLTALVLMLARALQTQPSVAENPVLDNIAINTIEQLIVDNAPARIGAAGELSINLDNDELNLLAAFALQRLLGTTAINANVQVAPETASIDIAIPLQNPVLPLYLNLYAELSQTDPGFELASIKLGNLPIPAWFIRSILSQGEKYLVRNYVNYHELSDLGRSLTKISFTPNAAIMNLDWEPQMFSRVQSQVEQFLLSPESKQRILTYYSDINTLLDDVPQDSNSVSLDILLYPLFAKAKTRSLGGGDIVAEHRALLQALSLYVNESDVTALTTSTMQDNPPLARRFTVTIQRRQDLAQHFTSSAAMTANVGADIAEILATSKEAHDARYRSGFSFSDLAANISGIAFGSAATSSPERALVLQERLAAATQETDYMPVVARDYTGLTEDDFSQQYQDRISQAYLDRVAEINSQIAVLPIYRSD
jgi:uncharacterized protein YfiM (DUF2279 family)